jgi:hypothetical protein
MGVDRVYKTVISKSVQQEAALACDISFDSTGGPCRNALLALCLLHAISSAYLLSGSG